MAILSRTSRQINASVQTVGVAAAAGGDSVANVDGKAEFWINNGGGASINVTILVQNPSQFTASGVPVTLASIVVAVPAGTSRLFGPFSPSAYNDAAGFVQITYSAVTSVTIGAYAYLP